MQKKYFKCKSGFQQCNERVRFSCFTFYFKMLRVWKTFLLIHTLFISIIYCQVLIQNINDFLWLLKCSESDIAKQECCNGSDKMQKKIVACFHSMTQTSFGGTQTVNWNRPWPWPRFPYHYTTIVVFTRHAIPPPSPATNKHHLPLIILPR